MIFERVQTGLVLVLGLNTILGFQYRASTRLGFDSRTNLESVPRFAEKTRQVIDRFRDCCTDQQNVDFISFRACLEKFQDESKNT